MCAGSAPRATIVQPDTGAYDRMAAMQMEALRRQEDGALALQQGRLNQTLSSEQQGLERLREAKVLRANQTAADTQRLLALVGTPPPEEAAASVRVGSRRTGSARPQGKRGLRIDPAAAGDSGINITGA